MINFRNFTRVAIALSLASTPGSAAIRATHVGYTARAQAIEGVIAPYSISPFARKLECNDLAAPLKNYTWWGHAESNLSVSPQSRPWL